MTDLFVVVVYRGAFVPLFESAAAVSSARGQGMHAPGSPDDFRDGWDTWIRDSLHAGGVEIEDGIWVIQLDEKRHCLVRWITTEDWAHILVSDRPVSSSEGVGDRQWHRCPGRHYRGWFIDLVAKAVGPIP